jgi:hypothetical protein
MELLAIAMRLSQHPLKIVLTYRWDHSEKTLWIIVIGLEIDIPGFSWEHDAAVFYLHDTILPTPQHSLRYCELLDTLANTANHRHLRNNVNTTQGSHGIETLPVQWYKVSKGRLNR